MVIFLKFLFSNKICLKFYRFVPLFIDVFRICIWSWYTLLEKISFVFKYKYDDGIIKIN
jgi:hypothetical protein